MVRENAASWAVAGKHVYLGYSRGSDPARIVRLDPESGKREEIYRFPAHTAPFVPLGTSLSVAGDERTIYYDGYRSVEFDIVMVEGLR